MDPDPADPLKEKQESEDREMKEQLAASMGLTVEEMDALDMAAEAPRKPSEYLEALLVSTQMVPAPLTGRIEGCHGRVR